MLYLPEAAAKIDPSHLADFLTQVSDDLWSEPDLQILKYYHFLSNELSEEVSFPWEKVFKEPTLSTLIDVPLYHIPKRVYEISVEWINKLPSETLGDFALWACDVILTDWRAQRTSSDYSLVAAFVAVAMVLRGKPDALTVLVRMVRKRPRYLEQDRVLLIVWLTAQASQVDLYAGLYSWARYLLPLVGKECCSPQSMDLILQLVENILSHAKARTILMNRAVREGERRIPLPSFKILLRLTFPAPSARATERFEAIYPLLKEVALVPERGGRMKQIFTFFLKLAGEGTGNPVLAKEATSIAIWSVTVNAGCFRHWENLYTENLEASVALLKKIVDEWKDHPLTLSSSPMDTVTLSQTMKSFRLKNEKAITEGGANCSLYKEADKSCKVISGMISGRLHRGSDWLEDFATITTYVLVAAIVLVLSFQ